MQTILPPSGNTIKILGKARSAEHGLRWMHYVLAQPVEGGVLVFHTLTRALLLLTPEEYAAPDNLPELRDGWFRVPQEIFCFWTTSSVLEGSSFRSLLTSFSPDCVPLIDLFTLSSALESFVVSPPISTVMPWILDAICVTTSFWA